MRHLFTLEGDAALAGVLRLQPLLAFDFDGTLAPIVARPEEARVSNAVASRLRALSARLPVAIVTGRSVADVRDRLGFEPHFVVGSHGAEDEFDPQSAAARTRALDGLRAKLIARAATLSDAGVTVEDKGPSIAMHYRLSRQREQALASITEVLSSVRATLRIFAGKMVVNAMAKEAPDKAEAVHSLVARCGAGAAFFAGDDLNDEPVFSAAPDHWLTLRVGREGPVSSARFCLDGPQEMALALDRLAALQRKVGRA